MSQSLAMNGISTIQSFWYMQQPEMEVCQIYFDISIFHLFLESIDICHLIDFELSLSGKKLLTQKNPFSRWIRSPVNNVILIEKF